MPLFHNVIFMMENFDNILEDFTNETANDFLWSSRKIEFTKAFNQAKPISCSELKSLVYRSDELKKFIQEAYQQNIPKYVVQRQAMDILHEIGYAYDLSVIRLLGLIVIKTLRKTLSGLYINKHKLISIKNEMGDCPIVFVPSHRSYGDFILMAFICFHYNISIPCVAAGKDFLSMKFMGKLLRKTKAFFLRRTFSDDPLYRTIFKEYIRVLTSREESPIEFFIEGTRSRTGKSLMPKFGFLTMLLEAYFSRDIPDIKFIPVNISYDRILEENLFAHELIGIPKPKESTRGLIKGLKALNGNYGKIFINFGDPIPLREIFHEGDDSRYHRNELIKIRELAFKIVEKQQSLQTFSCFNLLTIIIHDNIMNTRSYSISLKDSIDKFKWLLQVFEKYEARVYYEGEIKDALKSTISVHSSLVELSDGKNISLKLEGDIVFPNKDDTYTASGNFEKENKTLLQTVPFMMLQIYVNPSLSVFARSIIIVTILKNLYDAQPTNSDIVYGSYEYLYDIFKHEFVLNGKSKQIFNENILKLKDLGVIEDDEAMIKLNPNNNIIPVFLNLIHPFIVSVYTFCLFLNEFNGESIDGKQQGIFKMVQQYALKKIEYGEIEDYYCLSLDSISNSFNSFLEMHIILKNEVPDKYVANEERLNKATRYFECLLHKGNNKITNSKKSYFQQTRAKL